MYIMCNDECVFPLLDAPARAVMRLRQQTMNRLVQNSQPMQYSTIRVPNFCPTEMRQCDRHPLDGFRRTEAPSDCPENAASYAGYQWK